MTQPAVETIKRNGSRFYVDPVSGAKVPSVTSIVGCLPKRALQFWRGKMVAECAVEDFGVVADFVSKGNPSAAIDHLKRAPDRSSGKAAKTGTDVHGLCLIDAAGERRPLPDIDGAAVLTLRPDGYQLIPVRLGDDVFDTFRALIEVSKWEHEVGKTVIGKTPVDPINTENGAT